LFTLKCHTYPQTLRKDWKWTVHKRGECNQYRGKLLKLVKVIHDLNSNS
jgi:hypothetical protein